MSVDLDALGPDFALPMFVFQGAEDDIAPTVLARAWFDAIRAPRKAFETIPDAGHLCIATRADVFLTLLDREVRPLATEQARP